MSNIVFSNVRKVFDSGLCVLNGVNLKIEKGESHIILGQSGGGKSVLIRCLLGILELTEGDIVVDGISVKDPDRWKEYMKKFSILFQGNALFDSMTILQNVKFAASQINKSKEAVDEIAREKLHAVGLEDRVFDLYPAEISGGMQKRAALARAISLEPEVLVFDEPTSGLDPITGGVICNLLKDTVQSLGVTAITITHDLRVAEFLADRVSLLNKGVMVWTGHADDMRGCGNEFVENFYKASNVILRK
ncbi:MAG: ATP-binding cassette domain-containing protein [Alphaproteobacteria bacterium]|nr:ATP-binding cassette domain-containing protein [Alphaproteobacteria bacterium]MCR4555390.1 ATP-binding cassette domain-containing protein [Alphaproteobacteria bacterium]